MDIKLKADFIEYVKNKIEENNSFLANRGINLDNINDASIFLLADVFSDFLQDEYNCTQDVFTFDIANMDNLEFKNGKLVNKNKEEDNKPAEEGTEKAASDTPETASVENSEQQNISSSGEAETKNSSNPEEDSLTYTDILNNLFEDEEFLKEFDTDKDGQIGEEEFKAFQDKIKGLDGQEDNLSMEDIITYVNEKLSDPEADTETDQKTDIEGTNQTEESSTNNTTSSVGGSYGGGGGSYNYNSASNQPRGLDSMTVEELQTKLATAQDDLSQKQETLTNISNGTDPQISAFKEDMDTSLEAFNDALEETDDKDAKELASVNTQIAEKEQAIQDKDNEIFNQEATVQEKTEAYEVASANLEDLKSKQQILQTTDTSEMSEKQKQRIEERKTAVAAAIAQAETAKQTALNNKTEAENKLRSLKDEKDKLETKEPTLEDLEEKQNKLEEKLSDLLSEEPLKSLKEAYETAKTTYETESASALTQAQNAVTEASNEVTKINDALRKAQERENERDYSPIDIGESILEFAKQFLGDSEANNLADKFVQQYGGYDSSSTPWCAAFVEYVLRNSGEYDSIPEWYKTANGSYDAPKWGCGAVLSSAPQGARRDVYSAKPGDLILFNWSGSRSGGADHIGFFVGIENGKVITLEGNTSDQVAYRSYDLNSPYIRAILDITYTG